MKAPPAFQFYPADWLSSAAVASMSLAAQGAYIRLLCHQWQDGSIPSDRKKLARMVHTERRNSGTFWEQVLAHFKLEIEPGRIANAKLEEVRSRQQINSLERSQFGKLGADKRWHSHSLAIEEPMAKNGSSSSSLSRREEYKENPLSLSQPIETETQPEGMSPSKSKRKRKPKVWDEDPDILREAAGELIAAYPAPPGIRWNQASASKRVLKAYLSLQPSYAHEHWWILETVAEKAKSSGWLQESGRFIPNPEKFVREFLQAFREKEKLAGATNIAGANR